MIIECWYCLVPSTVGVYTAVFSTWTAKTMVGPFMATFACSSLGIKITEVCCLFSGVV